jgi:hypothetical protein
MRDGLIMLENKTIHKEEVKMKSYKFVEFEVKETQLLNALQKGLGRSLDDREKRYIKWHSTNDYETSGLILDWFMQISENNLNSVIGVDEASELWDISAGYIKNLCADGKIKCKKVGKTWVIDANQPNPSRK